jgi:hypothetical protein
MAGPFRYQPYLVNALFGRERGRTRDVQCPFDITADIALRLVELLLPRSSRFAFRFW